MVHRRGCVLTVYVCTYIRGTGRNYHLSFIAPVPSGGLLTASGILISSEKNYAFKQGSVFSVFFVTGSDGVKPGVLDVPLVPSSKIKEYELLRPMRIHVLRAAEATPCTDEGIHTPPPEQTLDDMHPYRTVPRGKRGCYVQAASE
ncbi:hypothetical protein CISG_08028 [Coccidioides immitis RMSCC 3703]|uniref:Uncharacterized protein n=2 Tax=Coccidioides immitis TaxID=5501 RepID=A0A0J8R7M7_COCIT|nr:hypothetical protein CIRG_07570 [Coccidioides immitis RMSCC 2394]KMU79748.1 hypothetical protein CISG_08028 [Coccidioides immitis RMSCC 3703]